MIPKEWKQWNSIEKATFIAQIATSAAFFGSSIFSYYSWQEAKGSREDQRAFFISEKRQIFKISRSEKVIGLEKTTSLNITLNNNGLSTAKIINMCVIGGQATQGNRMFFKPGDEFTCLNDNVEKDENLFCQIDLRKTSQSDIDISNANINVFANHSDIGEKFNSIYPVRLYYEGLFQDKHELLLWIEIK